MNNKRKRSRTSTSLDEIFDDDLTGASNVAVDTGKLSKSCDLCKVKKVKCDGDKPTCSFCIKNDVSCHYSLMKKPGLKPGYGKGVTQRLDSLEEELKDLRCEVSNLKNSKLRKDVPEKLRLNVDSTSSTIDTSSSSTSSKSVQIPSLLNPDSRNPNPNSNFGLPTNAQCLLLMDIYFKNINSIFPLLHPPTKFIELESAVHSMRDGSKPPLLLYSVILVSLKFLNNDQMDEQDMLKHYEYCKDQIISTSLKKINVESLQSMILLAYDALSGSVKVPESWNYVSIAADYANYLKLGEEKTTKLSIVSGDSPNSVNSSTMNSTDAKKRSKSINNKSINLLKKPKTWIDEESRRHCFWCIYILDKLYAISSSHDLKLKSSKITCLLPVKLSYWIDPNLRSESLNQVKTLKTGDVSPDDTQSSVSSIPTYDAFAYYIELNNIMGDIHSFSIEEVNIYQRDEVEQWHRTFMNLDNQINCWRRSLPFAYQKFLKNGKFNNNHKIEIFDILIYVFYYTTFVKLHSPAGYPHSTSEFFKPSEDSRAQCLEAADEVYSFVSQLPDITNDQDIFQKLGPHFGFFIWINCRILFVDVVYQGAKLSGQLGDYQLKLSFFAKVLKKIGKFWESSMVYHRILEFLHVADLSYVHNLATSPGSSAKRNSIAISEAGEDEEDSSDDQEITDENREPTKVVTDMRLGSHSLLYWFNKLASQTSKTAQVQRLSDEQPFTVNNLNSRSLSNFQTSTMQGFEEFQFSHDDFFNLLAFDLNGSGSFQDI